jgi:hypothetical protein
MLALPAAGNAFELLGVSAARDGQHYVLHIEARFAAGPDELLAVLTDYARVHELHPQMTESRSLGQVAPATEEVFTRFEGCVLLFCRTLDRVEHIRRTNHSLLATEVPGRGSFSEGSTVWHFEPHGEGAQLHYEARFVPAFWVAPFVGPGVLSRSVERMTIETMQEVERRARAARQ